MTTDTEPVRRKGGRPKLPPHLKKNTPQVAFRIPEDERYILIDNPRKAAGLDRTAYILRALRAAHAHRAEWNL